MSKRRVAKSTGSAPSPAKRRKLAADHVISSDSDFDTETSDSQRFAVKKSVGKSRATESERKACGKPGAKRDGHVTSEAKTKKTPSSPEGEGLLSTTHHKSGSRPRQRRSKVTATETTTLTQTPAAAAVAETHPAKRRKATKSSRPKKIKKQSPPVSSAPNLPTSQQFTMETQSPPPTVTAPDPQAEDDTHCVICMSEIECKKMLPLCRHSFCAGCIDQWFQKSNPICPSCGTVYGEITGNQPPGVMNYRVVNQQLPGCGSGSCIEITYQFDNGTQTHEHPNPGQRYSGTYRNAYLPNNAEGQKVLRLLKIAFDRRLVFTVGRSATTGSDNTVIWNDIHHKSNIHGGPTGFGYPDPTYLNRVQLELASKGVVE